jgi:uncharacterized SAM-dependent methyltransferase
MGLLIFIGVFLFCAVMAQMRNSPTGYTGKTKCLPHQWAYNKDGQLQCNRCNRTPEYYSRE